MGTRADFYIGRGANAQWLGSVAWDGYPEGVTPQKKEWPKGGSLLESKTAKEFAARLRQYFAGREDVTLPEQGWPWPWNDSHTTDFGYCFDAGRVWYWGEVEGKGEGWITAGGRTRFDKKTPGVYPDMTKVQNVTLGERSGVFVVGLK